MFIHPFSKGFRVLPRVIGRREVVPIVAVNELLLETGDFLLQETGDRIKL